MTTINGLIFSSDSDSSKHFPNVVNRYRSSQLLNSSSSSKSLWHEIPLNIFKLPHSYLFIVSNFLILTVLLDLLGAPFMGKNAL